MLAGRIFKGAKPSEGFLRAAIRSKLSTEYRGDNRFRKTGAPLDRPEKIRINPAEDSFDYGHQNED